VSVVSQLVYNFLSSGSPRKNPHDPRAGSGLHGWVMLADGQNSISSGTGGGGGGAASASADTCTRSDLFAALLQMPDTGNGELEDEVRRICQRLGLMGDLNKSTSDPPPFSPPVPHLLASMQKGFYTLKHSSERDVLFAGMQFFSKCKITHRVWYITQF